MHPAARVRHDQRPRAELEQDAHREGDLRERIPSVGVDPPLHRHDAPLRQGAHEQRVMGVQGRFPRYEGYTLAQIAFPVRVLFQLGARTLIVSNACGGMHPLWSPGDLMLIADHINLLGDNPLVGPNDDRLGPRFPDMSEPYDAGLRALARAVALAHGITLREGVYVAVAGATPWHPG